MTEAATGVISQRFCTDDFPERDRAAIWRDVFGKQLVKVDFESVDEAPLFYSARFQRMPQLSLAFAEHTAHRAHRTSWHLADGNDDLILTINTAGRAEVWQNDRNITMSPGEGVLLSSAAAGGIYYPKNAKSIVVGVPLKDIAAIVKDPELLVARTLKPSGSIRLLTAYLSAADGLAPAEMQELRKTFAIHVQDLIALSLGPTRDGADMARRRGVRAARLQSAKTFVRRHFHRHDLSAAAVATSLGVTPRYIHMLFEAEAESFSEFILGQRLAHAHAMLHDPAHRTSLITTIAFSSGFGDLSHFNRAFRRRYGDTPSAVRASMSR